MHSWKDFPNGEVCIQKTFKAILIRQMQALRVELKNQLYWGASTAYSDVAGLRGFACRHGYISCCRTFARESLGIPSRFAGGPTSCLEMANRLASR